MNAMEAPRARVGRRPDFPRQAVARRPAARPGQIQRAVRPAGVKFGHYANIGRRPTMEDAFIMKAPIIPELTTSGLFGIFDGHGGATASNFVAKKFISVITPKIKSARLAVAGRTGVKANYNQALVNTFKEIEEKLREITWTAGSCAIVALKIANRLLIANLGDSRAILSKNGRAVALSEEHKPDRPDESERITQAGETVDIIHGIARLSGNLAVSRAFGDFGEKQRTRGALIATPEIKEITIKPEDEFLILACDGIFERGIMNRQKAVDIVKEALRTNRNDPEAAAQALVHAAYDAGSNDNLSTLVVLFKHQ